MGEIISFFNFYLSQSEEKLFEELVGLDLLPEDIIFRMAPFGRGPSSTPGYETFPKIHVVSDDLIKNAQTPEKFLPETRAILEGPLPPAALDWYQRDYKALYERLGERYYGRGHLRDIIADRRESGREFRNEVERWRDRSISSALATATWRSLVKRLHPEWLEKPNHYYTPSYSLGQIYEATERTMRGRIVKATVIADYAMYDLYQEITETGMRGIGKVGAEDIRRLLAEEHPEVLRGKEIPA